ncbi:MAG: PAS domain S-box protein [Ardenticatenaceae bacterium]|nr:PAS domain S-box protein [Ardenticatenaceae bacterium]MCB8972531.1 PAS domain S-box protein [Ardenticatenaceae bacterium]
MENRFLSKASSVVVILATFIVFIGWQLDLPTFKQLLPGAPPTTPLTAFLLLCQSAALLLLNQTVHRTNTRYLSWAVLLLSGTAVLIGLFTVAQYLFGWQASVELWLYPKQVLQMQTEFPGRPSPHTAVSAILSGLAIILSGLPDPPQQKRANQVAIISLIIPWIALFGYITLTNPFYALQSNPQTGMSPITAACFLLLIFGILGWQPESGIVGLLRTNSPGGQLARQLLPFVILVTLLSGWGIHIGGSLGWFDPAIAFAISWGAGSLGFVALTIRQGFALHSQFLERQLVAKEREQMLEIVEKEEEKFRTLLESAPDALVIVNEAGKIVIANDQTDKLFEYLHEQLINQPIEILMPDRFWQNHSEFRATFFAKPHARPMGTGLELYGRCQNGREFPIEVSLNILETPEGKYALATIRNVTEQKLAAETLRQFNAKLEERANQMTIELRMRNEEIEQANIDLQKQASALEQSNLELQQFAFAASHDLQTPLRSISGFIQLLQQKYHDQLDEQANEWIGIAVENTLHMQQMIQDLLTFSRIDSPTYTFETIDLNEIFYEVMALLQYELINSPAKVTSGKLPIVRGNRTHLILLFQNLFGNGLKYNDKEQPTIHVSAEASDGKWVIAVEDNGIGIKEIYYSKIFDILRRLHTQDVYPGNGIGLAICRRIVERHGGEIWVTSNYGHGSTFYFTLMKKGENSG